MCGIIGIASNKPVSSNIIHSLKRLNIEVMILLELQQLAMEKFMRKNVLEELIILKKFYLKIHQKIF